MKVGDVVQLQDTVPLEGLLSQIRRWIELYGIEERFVITDIKFSGLEIQPESHPNAFDYSNGDLTSSRRYKLAEAKYYPFTLRLP